MKTGNGLNTLTVSGWIPNADPTRGDVNLGDGRTASPWN